MLAASASDHQPPREPHAEDPGVSSVVHRNIGTLMEVRRREEGKRTFSDRVADAITAFVGSMWCVYLHVLWFGGWILVNTGKLPVVKPFDRFPFPLLAMIACVETIFLATFILIRQNRMQRLADRRAELDLQISLLTEHELTRAIQLLDGLVNQLGAPRPEHAEREIDEIKRDIAPERVVEEIDKAEEGRQGERR